MFLALRASRRNSVDADASAFISRRFLGSLLRNWLIKKSRIALNTVASLAAFAVLSYVILRFVSCSWSPWIAQADLHLFELEGLLKFLSSSLEDRIQIECGADAAAQLADQRVALGTLARLCQQAGSFQCDGQTISSLLDHGQRFVGGAFVLKANVDDA